MKYLRSAIKGAEFWSRRILSAAASCLCDATTAWGSKQNNEWDNKGAVHFLRERERERVSMCVCCYWWGFYTNLHLCKTVNETIVAVEHIVYRPFMLSLGQCLEAPPAAPSSRLWRISGYSASGRSFVHFFSCGCTYSTYEWCSPHLFAKYFIYWKKEKKFSSFKFNFPEFQTVEKQVCKSTSCVVVHL